MSESGSIAIIRDKDDYEVRMCMGMVTRSVWMTDVDDVIGELERVLERGEVSDVMREEVHRLKVGERCEYPIPDGWDDVAPR